VADVLGLERLIDAVTAELGNAERYPYAAGIQPEFGFKQPPQQKGPRRIVWVPGNESGDAGQVAPPRYPGQIPNRPIANLRDYVTVTLTAFDAAAPENQRAQWKAARLLFDDWWRAVYRVAYGTFAIESVRWIKPPTERAHGASLRVVCLIESVVPDADSTSASADTKASITTTELGVSEIELVEAVTD
jgi:hypothetical protein